MPPESREPVAEELDYRIEACNQQMFAGFYSGHPTIHIPGSAQSCRRGGC